ncbi:MAG: FAD-binding oxidoreductase, partial [Elusimicrobiaceae bacterium]
LVIDELPSPGQGQNKAAIGGIRATHSEAAKIKVCLRSLEIFSGWKEKFGDDIGWLKGGYAFPAYTPEDETLMKNLLRVQKNMGLNIDWVGADDIKKLVPGINAENLRGGTFAPDDGSASPLLSGNAFFRRALKLGAEFRFKEKIISAIIEKGIVKGVKTGYGEYSAPIVINAAGANAKEVSALFGVDLSVAPDMHEAGITEPAARMFDPMVVDIRPCVNSKNFYFYQNSEGQIVFCMTPKPVLWGKNRDATSVFLPSIAQRMIDLLPRLADIKVRRTWRGLYPMTPDGSPIVHKFDTPKGYIAAVGMCGQGFMLGPGIGELVARMATGKTDGNDADVLAGLSAARPFSGSEAFS